MPIKVYRLFSCATGCPQGLGRPDYKLSFNFNPDRRCALAIMDNSDLTKIQQYVMHLRYVLAQHELDEVDPPEWFLNELKIAERLARIESEECEKFRHQLEI